MTSDDDGQGQTNSGGEPGGTQEMTGDPEPPRSPGEEFADPGAAQARCRALQAEVERLTALAASLQARLGAAERRRVLERELADAADLDAAVVLAEHALGAMDEPDAARAARDLRARMPFLFRAGPVPSAMAGRLTAPPPPDLAQEARETGDQRTLLRYLRAKRGF
ncbi:MAG: hypothetical protein FJ255_09370 [Phycisphaerae bacterium]|nr:hypothetical protein [Phycisphaerae bacterium]